MRPYVPGESLTGISVSETDTPELGGMIARNPDDHEDQWYVNHDYFEKNLVLDDIDPNIKAGLLTSFRILRYFEYAHLPDHLQEISKPFYDLAYKIAARPTQDFAEVAVALRKLRESKDCAVSAGV